MDSPGVLELDLAAQFGNSVKRKGTAYCYEYDYVHDVNILNNRISGIVRGSEEYDVELYYSLKSGGKGDIWIFRMTIDHEIPVGSLAIHTTGVMHQPRTTEV